MVTIVKGLAAAKEIRSQYVSATSDPVTWNQSLALEAALTEIQRQSRQIEQLHVTLQRIAHELQRR